MAPVIWGISVKVLLLCTMVFAPIFADNLIMKDLTPNSFKFVESLMGCSLCFTFRGMITAPTLALLLIAIGVVSTFAIGWKSPKSVPEVFLCLFGCVAIGVASSVAMYLLFSACLYLKICTQTNDQTVWSFLYPFMAIPLYWIAMLVGFFAKFWKSDEQEQQSN